MIVEPLMPGCTLNRTVAGASVSASATSGTVRPSTRPTAAAASALCTIALPGRCEYTASRSPPCTSVKPNAGEAVAFDVLRAHVRACCQPERDHVRARAIGHRRDARVVGVEHGDAVRWQRRRQHAFLSRDRFDACRAAPCAPARPSSRRRRPVARSRRAVPSRPRPTCPSRARRAGGAASARAGRAACRSHC